MALLDGSRTVQIGKSSGDFDDLIIGSCAELILIVGTLKQIRAVAGQGTKFFDVGGLHLTIAIHPLDPGKALALNVSCQFNLRF